MIKKGFTQLKIMTSVVLNIGIGTLLSLLRCN